MIANFFSFGLLDVVVGGGSTLAFPQSRCLAFSKYSKDYLFNGLIRKDHFFAILFYHFYVYTIAAELNIVAQLPFSLLGSQQVSANLPH